MLTTPLSKSYSSHRQFSNHQSSQSTRSHPSQDTGSVLRTSAASPGSGASSGRARARRAASSGRGRHCGINAVGRGASRSDIGRRVLGGRSIHVDGGVGRRIDNADHASLAMLVGGAVVPDWRGVGYGDGEGLVLSRPC